MTNKIKTIEVRGHRWFDAPNGNTYNASQIFVNGKLFTETRFQYGYDEYYLQAASEALNTLGVIESDKYVPLWAFCRDNDIEFYYSVSDGAKKHLFSDSISDRALSIVEKLAEACGFVEPPKFYNITAKFQTKVKTEFLIKNYPEKFAAMIRKLNKQAFRAWERFNSRQSVNDNSDKYYGAMGEILALLGIGYDLPGLYATFFVPVNGKTYNETSPESMVKRYNGFWD